MSVATTQGISLTGLEGEIVQIEVDVSKGLPGYQLLDFLMRHLTKREIAFARQ